MHAEKISSYICSIKLPSICIFWLHKTDLSDQVTFYNLRSYTEKTNGESHGSQDSEKVAINFDS